MGMKGNWKMFVESTKIKAESHYQVAQFWDKVTTMGELTMIFLSSGTSVLVLINAPFLATSCLSGVTTLISAIFGYLKPSGRRQTQLEASKDFRLLMMRMVRCETEKEYENLWSEYNKAILNEPFLPSKYYKKSIISYSMSNEFMDLADKKEKGLPIPPALAGTDKPDAKDAKKDDPKGDGKEEDKAKDKPDDKPEGDENAAKDDGKDDKDDKDDDDDDDDDDDAEDKPLLDGQ